jgi:hypothetical protein
MLRNALAFTGYSLGEFNTHSLRIGATTQSFLNGMDEKTIMANGVIHVTKQWPFHIWSHCKIIQH